MSNQSKGRKISKFTAQTTIPSNAYITYIESSTNYRIIMSDFLASIGATGTIVQDGAVTGTPVLDTAGSVNNIRNIEDGSGIKSSVSAENGVTLEHNFTEDTGGVELVVDLTTASPKFRSLVAGTGINVAAADGEIQIALSAIPASTKTIIINDINDFPAAVSGVITLAGDTEYAIRNDISTSNRFVLGDKTVLSGSDNLVVSLSYTGAGVMFTSASKSWTMTDISINCSSGTLLAFTGTGAEILQLKDTVISVDTLGAISDFAGIHFEDNQIAVITDGLSFSGTNGVILVDSALVTITAGTLFDLGVATFAGFSVTTGFYTLNGTSVFLDGAAASANINVGNLATVHNCRFFGTGTPLQTITTGDIRWFFTLNDEIPETHQDCLMSQITNATATTISVATTPVKLAGSWNLEEAFFFTTDATGTMTYVGDKDIEIDVSMSFSAAPVSGTNKSINFYVAKNGSHVVNSRAYNNLSAGDVGRTTLIWRISLSKNDYVEAFVANDTDTIDVLVEDAVMRLS